MKNITIIMLSSAACILAACGGADSDVADAADDLRDTTTDAAVEMADTADDTVSSGSMAGAGVGEFTKADYMKACTAEAGGLTETQCECTLDFYSDNGMSISDMNDEAKMAAFMEGLPMEKMADMSQCMM